MRRTDSGINALSVAHRFLPDLAVESVETLDASPGSVYRAAITFGVDGVGEIGTTWDVDAGAKQSTLTFAGGASVHLDHREMRVLLRRDGVPLEEYRYAGDVPRLQLHYRNAYRSLFVDRAGYYGAADTRLLHRALFTRKHP